MLLLFEEAKEERELREGGTKQVVAKQMKQPRVSGVEDGVAQDHEGIAVERRVEDVPEQLIGK